MNDHLPECWAVMCECEDTHFYSEACSYGCICPSLRACEERILNLNPVALGVLIAQKARERALETAREAVLAVEPFNVPELLLKQEDVIAAIDSLRGNNAIY